MDTAGLPTKPEVDPAAQALLNAFMGMAELLEKKGLLTRAELADHLAAKHAVMLTRGEMPATAELVQVIVEHLRD